MHFDAPASAPAPAPRRVIGGDANDATKTTCTPAFQSPEEVARTSVDPYAADLWALGCCLFCFVCGRLPFVGSCVVRHVHTTNPLGVAHSWRAVWH